MVTVFRRWRRHPSIFRHERWGMEISSTISLTDGAHPNYLLDDTNYSLVACNLDWRQGSAMFRRNQR